MISQLYLPVLAGGSKPSEAETLKAIQSDIESGHFQQYQRFEGESCGDFYGGFNDEVGKYSPFVMRVKYDLVDCPKGADTQQRVVEGRIIITDENRSKEEQVGTLFEVQILANTTGSPAYEIVQNYRKENCFLP